MKKKNSVLIIAALALALAPTAAGKNGRWHVHTVPNGTIDGWTLMCPAGHAKIKYECSP